MGNYAVKETNDSKVTILFLTRPYSVTNKTAHDEVPDSSLEERIEELDDKIKLSESSLASHFNRTTAPRNQISCASIVAAINNRSDTDNVDFNTLKSELLTRELEESMTLDRFLVLMELYIQRSRLTSRLVEQTEQAKAEREGRDVGSTDHMKPFDDHRMFVHMELIGMSALAEVLPRRGRDEPVVVDDKVTQKEAHVEPEVKKEKEDEVALYK